MSYQIQILRRAQKELMQLSKGDSAVIDEEFFFAQIDCRPDVIAGEAFGNLPLLFENNATCLEPLNSPFAN